MALSPKVKIPTTLAEHLKLSQSNIFLLMGPEAPTPGWVYRDFRAMPQAMWLELLELLGENNIRFVSFNSEQQPPAPMCRASMWISPAAQISWERYIRQNMQ